jgi:hypothetical protein
MTLGKYLSDELFAAGAREWPGRDRAATRQSPPWPQEQRPAARTDRTELQYIIRRDASGSLGRDTPRRQGSRRDHACESSTTNKRAGTVCRGAASVPRGPARGWLESDRPCGRGRARAVRLSPEDGYGAADTQNRETKRSMSGALGGGTRALRDQLASPAGTQREDTDRSPHGRSPTW